MNTFGRAFFFALFPCVSLLASDAFAADAEKGKQLFAARCASCHGPEGAGDGPVAASLPPAMKPANMQGGTYKKVTDDASMKELIKKGGAAFGLSPLMAAQPTLSDEEIDNIIAYVNSLKK